jgi:hypothetical protein
MPNWVLAAAVAVCVRAAVSVVPAQSRPFLGASVDAAVRVCPTVPACSVRVTSPRDGDVVASAGNDVAVVGDVTMSWSGGLPPHNTSIVGAAGCFVAESNAGTAARKLSVAPVSVTADIARSPVTSSRVQLTWHAGLSPTEEGWFDFGVLLWAGVDESTGAALCDAALNSPDDLRAADAAGGCWAARSCSASTHLYVVRTTARYMPFWVPFVQTLPEELTRLGASTLPPPLASDRHDVAAFNAAPAGVSVRGLPHMLGPVLPPRQSFAPPPPPLRVLVAVFGGARTRDVVSSNIQRFLNAADVCAGGGGGGGGDAAAQQHCVSVDVIACVYDGSDWRGVPWVGRREVMLVSSPVGQMKWWYVKRLMTPAIVSPDAYDYVVILDDDVDVAPPAFHLGGFVHAMHRAGVLLAQPGHAPGSSTTWPHVMADPRPGFVGRWTNMVECGPLVVFSTAVWSCVWKLLQPDLSSGYGAWRAGVCACACRSCVSMGVDACACVCVCCGTACRLLCLHHTR